MPWLLIGHGTALCAAQPPFWQQQQQQQQQCGISVGANNSATGSACTFTPVSAEVCVLCVLRLPVQLAAVSMTFKIFIRCEQQQQQQ
jgi:hypothetical protein